MLYGVLYGAERMVVEGMRTDSLYIGSTTVRVSQLLSAIIVVVAAVLFVYFMVKYKKGRLPKALVLDDLDAMEDANKKEKEEALAKKAEKKRQKELKKQEKEQNKRTKE